jgi:Xaa-Pro aminopeptidase
VTSAATPPFADLDIARMRRARRVKLIDALEANGLAGLVVLGQSNVVYATGARPQAADVSRAVHQRMVAVIGAADDAPHLFGAFEDGVPPDLPADHVHPSIAVATPSGARALVEVLPAGPLAVDEYPLALRDMLRGRETKDAAPLLAGAKVVKTPDEIECIRRAQSINQAAILDVESMLEPGVRATDLSGRFLRRIFELGATANTVDPIWQVMPPSIVDGPYSATGDVVFPTPTRPRELNRGDVIWVDTGISYEGYASDFGRTWVVGGEVSARQRDQFTRWRAVVDAVRDVVKPGATAADLARAALTIERERRPWLPHLYLAHGTGTDSAEGPLVGTDLGIEFDETVVLAPGMVVVLEPVIWDDGAAGYRGEEILAVTESGYAMLSDHHYRPYA